MTAKKRRRHTPDQIIRKLTEGHNNSPPARSSDEVFRHLEIGESTWQRWLAQYGFSGQLWSFQDIGAQQDASSDRRSMECSFEARLSPLRPSARTSA